MNLEPDCFEDQLGQAEDMDYMDIDQVVEVPDTPERFIAECNNDGNMPGNYSDGSSSCRVITKTSINENLRNEPREKGKSVSFHANRRLFVRAGNRSNSSDIMLGSSSTSKNLLATIDNAHHEKGKSLYNSNDQRSNFQENSTFVDLTEENRCDHVFGNATGSAHPSRKYINGFPEVDTLGLDTLSKSSTDKFGQRFDRGKGAIRQKRLVRNGCISPHNIAKFKEVTEKQDNGRVAKDSSVDGHSTTVDIKDLTTEDEVSHGFKGKGVSFYSSFCAETDARNNNLSQRSSRISKEQTNATDNLDGWISTHKPLTTVNLQLPDGNPRGKASSSSTIDQQKNGIVPHVNDSSEPSTSTSRSTRNKNTRGGDTLDSVIALDELSPDENCGSRTDSNSNEDPGVKALQVEADEMLARELQEQLYNEELASVFGVDEMDPDLALATAMQQEHSSHAIHPGARPAYRPASRGGSSVSNLYQNSRSNSSRNQSSQRAGHGQSQTSTSTRLDRLRGRFPGRPRTMSSTTTPGSSIFPSNMDLDMRMQILEALEAFNDMDFHNDLLQVGREFNENDYEMLLALDDNNHQHGGATHAQINNLPQSTVQAGNLQECAICLETPTIGETIRHLPCLHGFHKDCIDEWLRRKTSCPVCKSSVT